LPQRELHQRQCYHQLTTGISPDEQRSSHSYQTIKNGTTNIASYIYDSDYEAQLDASGNIMKEWTYIRSQYGLVGVLVNDKGTKTLYNIHTDHLGSIRMLTQQDGTLAEVNNFDAWGKRTSTAGSMLLRGYVGQEHYDNFGLINMNNRMYEPVTGRFLSPDPLAYTPKNIMFDPYSYAASNPLKYADANGLDYYDNGSGTPVWIDGNTPSFSYEGVDYTNLGNSYTSWQFDMESGTAFWVTYEGHNNISDYGSIQMNEAQVPDNSEQTLGMDDSNLIDETGGYDFLNLHDIVESAETNLPKAGDLTQAYGVGNSIQATIFSKIDVNELGKAGQNYVKYIKIGGYVAGAVGITNSVSTFIHQPTIGHALDLGINLTGTFAPNPLVGVGLGLATMTPQYKSLVNETLNQQLW
jgi:RHS repeat-associated protein